MAINYKEEWEKLLKAYGSKNVITYHPDEKSRLRDLMHLQIQGTIDDREKLMEEYVKNHITTEIDGTDKEYHHIKIVVDSKARGPIGTMYIHKKDFDAWCEKKGGK